VLAALDSGNGGADLSPQAVPVNKRSVFRDGGRVLMRTEPLVVSQTCPLKACLQHGAAAPKLFVQEHGDGSGHRMQNLLDGMAVAAKNGMNFGGVVPLGHAGHSNPPIKKFRRVVDAFFGQNASTTMFFEPKFDATFNDVRTFEKTRSSIHDGQLISLPSADSWQRSAGGKSEDYYTPALTASILSGLQKYPLKFAPRRPKVALHVRRGDLRQSQGRAMNDEYFYRVVNDVRKLLPEADVHIWSSTENWNDELEQNGKAYWKSSDFDGYRQRKMTVHLDNADEEDLVGAWANMARADVYIMSRSSFSWVPAVLNRGCVIYPGNSEFLSSWVAGDNEKRKTYWDELKTCIQRAVPAAR